MDALPTTWVALLIVVGLSLLGAGGCASQPPAMAASYAVTGKAVVRSPQGSQRMSFRWQQARGEYRISVWGALGVGRVQLSGTQQAISVFKGGGDAMSGPAAQMMDQYLGWSVPLEAMGSWLLGEPATTLGQDLVTTDDRGRVTGLRQGGWEIEFSQYEWVNDRWRPKRMDITGGQISMRVVLSSPKPVMGS